MKLDYKDANFYQVSYNTCNEILRRRNIYCAIPEKKPNREKGWGHGISRGIEERACGNSGG